MRPRSWALPRWVILEQRERDLPVANRYLPVTGDSLSKRMRTETILVCRK